ncbi:MAG: molybdate ABC transporter substrate-binding protein [Porticoccaceae bacterium]|nr:molybdate ABC transporter substrate-binding protein [Porticoccaceae bacterium]
MQPVTKRSATGNWLTTTLGKLLIILLSTSALTAVALEQKPLRVATAANFTATLRVLAQHYQNETGITVELSSGSSGKLYAQIVQGAPYDVFFSADVERPQGLEAAGLTLKDSRFTYALGRLVLWSPDKNLNNKPPALNENINNATSLVSAALNKSRSTENFRFIALANPRHAPYGKAAREVLQASGDWQTLQKNQHLVIASNVAQARQFTATGNAQLGFVALSQIMPNASEVSLEKHILIIPDSLYTPIEQQAVILKRSTQQNNALAFINWIKNSANARDIIETTGYKIPSLSPQAKPHS